MFEINTEIVTAKEYDGKVTFKGNGNRAERKHRQIIAEIECCETRAEVDETLIREADVIEAIAKHYPEYEQAIAQAADDHKAILAS